MKLKKKHIHIIIIAFLSLIVYFNTFFNGFVYDDHFFIVGNPEIRSLKNIPSYFSEPSVGNLYRPLRTALYPLVFSIWKLNPIGYHLNAIMLYALISILVYLIVFEVIGNREFSLMVSLLFIAHPAHTARVANMTASFDLMGILFMLLSIWLYIKYSKNNSIKNLILSVLFFLLGLFSSEEALMTPLYILLYEGGKNTANANKWTASKKIAAILFFAIIIVFLVLRYFVLGQVGRTAEYFMGGFTTRLF